MRRHHFGMLNHCVCYCSIVIYNYLSTKASRFRLVCDVLLSHIVFGGAISSFIP